MFVCDVYLTDLMAQSFVIGGVGRHRLKRFKCDVGIQCMMFAKHLATVLSIKELYKIPIVITCWHRSAETLDLSV